MTILMEVSPNIDSNLDLDDGEGEEHETKLNRNKAKRRKKSINGRKLDVKMESIPPPLNGHAELTPADDEPEDNADALNRVSDGWQLSTVGGTDLTRLGAAVSAGGAHVFVAGRGSVLVLAARSGKIVRELNTGEVTAIQRSNSDSEVVVAGKNKVVVWDFKEVKVVNQYKFSLHKMSKHEQGLQSVYIPENFHQDHEIFVTVRKKEKKMALHRINLSSGSNHAIFSNVKPGSVHVGDGDNLVSAISDHKEHGFQDATLLVYNKNLAKNMSFHADKERPFTCVRVHPASNVVAVGDTSGRIIVYAGLDQAQPSKSILHWHSLPVTVLAWSLEGSVLYSAGAEAVLCKWRQEEGSKPSFVPRIGGAVVGLAAGAGVSVVQLDSNKIKIVDSLSDSVLCSVSGLARNQRGYPAGLQSDRDRLVMNGGTGLVQVYRPATDTVHSYDITQQNLVTKERVCEPHNSEVEAVAVSRDGGLMATVDCLWSDIPRVLLKLWHWSEETSNYRLNTQVETPHAGGVQTMAFQPSSGPGPLLLTVGGDRAAKVWQLGASWACVACLTFRQLAATGGDWSSDGTLLAVSFQHLVTLWAGAGADTRLVSTLALDAAPQPVTSLVMGRNSCSRYLYTATAARTVIWDLVTSAPCWSLPLAPSPHTTLVQAEDLPLLAIVQKSCITIVSPPGRAVVATISDVNCTGGAAWLARDLYCLTYCGELVRASRDPRPAVARAAVLQQPGSRVSSWLAAPRGSGGGGEEQGVGLVTAPGPRRDIESLLALPLHTLPAPAQLATSLIRNRLVALPRHRRRHHKAEQRHGAGDTVGVGDGQSKEEQKIKDMAIDLLADNNNRKYKEADYWNLRFQNEDSYEWLLTYNDIKSKLDNILHKYDKSAKILQLGCGNSNFANDMFNDGFIDITNIDISHVCVEKMSGRFPNMSFFQMDMTSLTFEDQSFDIVIEKATLDSLLVDCKSPWDLTDPSQLAVLKCLEQVKRVLRPGGVFLSLTFSPPHFRVPLLASPGLDWAVEVAVCGGRDTLLDYYLLSCRHGDPGPALAKWAVGRNPDTLDTSPAPCSSDEESEEYIARINTSCFDTDTETDTETESSSMSAAPDS